MKTASFSSSARCRIRTVRCGVLRRAKACAARLLVFRPQPKSAWVDLDKWLDHPLSLFNVAPVDAAIRKLTGRQFGDFALRLRVASEVQKKGDRFFGRTGCRPHACNSDAGLSRSTARRTARSWRCAAAKR